jgi:tetratricopeptide (TPR) repeat protein
VPRITDFGLAKKLDGVGLSVTGEILGTPSYMSPEQAKGLVHQIGPTADVYALGAILYECLTGRPPFQAASVADTLLLVLTEEPAPVRRLQPKVPRDLETICSRCLHKDPNKRYPSAAQLADDLRRFREGKSILARPIGPLEQTYRWYRRHPALAWLSMTVAALLIAVTVVSVDRYFKVSRINTDLESSRQIAEHNADQARKSYALASRSMEQTVFRIAANPYLKDGGFFALRKQLLEPAIRFYRELVELKSDDPKLEADRGRAFGQLAAVRAMLEETEQASEDYRAMLAVFSALVQDHPDEPSYRLEMSKANRGLGLALRDLARYKEADAAFARAGELARDLVARYPDRVEYLDERISFEFWRGVNAYKAAHFEEARKVFLRTLDMQKQRDRRFAPTRVSRDSLAGMHTNLGRSTLSALKRYDEALGHVQASLAIRRKLIEEVPDNAEYRMSVVSGLENLGVAYHRLGRLEASAEAARESNRLARKLVEQFPTLPASRRLLAHNCHNLAAGFIAAKRSQEADRLQQEATALFEGLAAEFPNVPQNKQELGTHYVSRGSHLFERNPEAGLALAEKAVRVLGEGAAADPRNPEMRLWLGKAHLLRMSTLGLLGRWEEGLGAGERALVVEPSLAKDGTVARGLFFTRWQVRQILLPALRLARAGKHVEAARTANHLVERRMLGALHAFAAGNVLPGLAALAAARTLAQREGPVGSTLFDAACVFALCAEAAGKENSLLGETYAARAVELLARARDKGYFAGAQQQKQLDSDKDLEPLRQREDFHKLRAAVGTSPGR